jgi:hypothetical protein
VQEKNVEGGKERDVIIDVCSIYYARSGGEFEKTIC